MGKKKNSQIKRIGDTCYIHHPYLSNYYLPKLIVSENDSAAILRGNSYFVLILNIFILLVAIFFQALTLVAWIAGDVIWQVILIPFLYHLLIIHNVVVYMNDKKTLIDWIHNNNIQLIKNF